MDEDLLALLNGGAAPEQMLAELMPVLGRVLDCDRCVLFLREPHSRRSRATHAWQRRPEFVLARPDEGWQAQPPDLPELDPLFAEALRNPTALFIDDVATADPSLVNREYEREHFRHRALVHAPLYHEGLLYGVLEPCVMETSRLWSAEDRETVALAQVRIAGSAAEYVARHCR